MTQTQRIEHRIIRILNPDGATVGAGFVVAGRLAVACAHVVRAASSGRDGWPKVKKWDLMEKERHGL